MMNIEELEKIDPKLLKEIRNATILSTLEALVDAFGRMKLSEFRPLMDRMNDCLSDTPFMFFLFGDGLGVTSREDMCRMNAAMFDKPYGDYSM